MRLKVWERDHGVCARCGLDTHALNREIAALRSAISFRTASIAELQAAHQQTQDLLARHRFPRTWTSMHGGVARSLWEADHIVPVKDGGGACGLENYRTLCWPCHVIVTGEWKRARSKRGAKEAQRQASLNGYQREAP